jgi:hypothetical protein
VCHQSAAAAIARRAAVARPEQLQNVDGPDGASIRVDGHLQANIKAEAISARPLRSKYEGQLTAVLMQGKEPLLDVQTVVSGEYEGSPSGGMTEALARFLSTIELASQAATRPTSRPAAP